MYNQIYNPVNRVWYNLNSDIGKNTIKNFIMSLHHGGARPYNVKTRHGSLVSKKGQFLSLGAINNENSIKPTESEIKTIIDSGIPHDFLDNNRFRIDTRGKVFIFNKKTSKYNKVTQRNLRKIFGKQLDGRLNRAIQNGHIDTRSRKQKVQQKLKLKKALNLGHIVDRKTNDKMKKFQSKVKAAKILQNKFRQEKLKNILKKNIAAKQIQTKYRKHKQNEMLNQAMKKGHIVDEKENRNIKNISQAMKKGHVVDEKKNRNIKNISQAIKKGHVVDEKENRNFKKLKQAINTGKVIIKKKKKIDDIAKSNSDLVDEFVHFHDRIAKKKNWKLMNNEHEFHTLYTSMISHLKKHNLNKKMLTKSQILKIYNTVLDSSNLELVNNSDNSVDKFLISQELDKFAEI